MIPARNIETRIFAFAVALALAAMLAAPAFAQSQEKPRRSISVAGHAEINVEPDIAMLDGGVTTEAKEAGTAAADNAKIMAAIFDALKGAGIADKDLQTTNFSIQPVWPAKRPDANRSEDVQIVGYRVSNRVRVKVRDMTRVASVLDAMVKAGANDIGGISFVVSEQDKRLDDARAEAMRDAKRKADIFARTAGVKLGAPLSISESGSAPPRPMAYRSLAPAAEAAPIAHGEQTLQVHLSVTYEIAP